MVLDTMSPPAACCIGRLTHHQVCFVVGLSFERTRSRRLALTCVARFALRALLQATVTALSILPGGWLLAAGDEHGGLSCTDLRMLGSQMGEAAAIAASNVSEAVLLGTS
jgi:hypothetical protein